MIEREIANGGYPFPPELILSLTYYESRGRAGAVNPTSKASGLIQVMPGTLDWYNSKNPNAQVSLATMRENTEDAGAAQIRVGLWVLGVFWKSAYKWIRKQRDNVPVGDLARFGDAFYAGGPGKVQRMAKNMQRTWAAWQGRYPNSTITKHADVVLQTTEEQSPTWSLDAVNRFVEGETDSGDSDDSGETITPVEPPAKKGLIIGLAVLAIAALLFKNWNK